MSTPSGQSILHHSLRKKAPTLDDGDPIDQVPRDMVNPDLIGLAWMDGQGGIRWMGVQKDELGWDLTEMKMSSKCICGGQGQAARVTSEEDWRSIWRVWRS